MCFPLFNRRDNFDLMNNREVFKEKEADFKGRIKNLKAKTGIYHERVCFFIENIIFFKIFHSDHQNRKRISGVSYR